MLIAQNILRLIVFNLKVHNFQTTPLHKFKEQSSIELKVSAQTTGIYIFKTIFGFFFSLCQLFQIFYQFQTGSLKIYGVIQSVLVTGSILIHFVIVSGHFKKRQEIANLFNEFIAFEKRHNGNTKTYTTLLSNCSYNFNECFRSLKYFSTKLDTPKIHTNSWESSKIDYFNWNLISSRISFCCLHILDFCALSTY